MADSFPRRRRLWPVLLGGFLALLLVLYFVLTSGFFVKSFVLPQVADSLNSELSVGDLSLSPFSSLELREVKLTPRGAPTLATVGLVRVRYSLMAILGGKIDVSEITVDNPVVTYVLGTNGSDNLPKPAGSGTSSRGSAPGGAAPKVDVRNVAIRNAALKATLASAAGDTVVSVGGLNVALDRLANGASGKLTLGATLDAVQPGGSLSGRAEGAFDLGLDASLLPTLAKGSLRADIPKAAGSFADLAGLVTVLDADATATEIRRCRLTFGQGGQDFGQVLLSGPFEAGKREGRIGFTISGIDRRVLKAVAPTLPYDFGKTRIGAEGRLDLVQGGELVALQGRLGIDDLTLTTAAGSTPSVKFDAEYKASVNMGEKTAVIEKLSLDATRVGRPMIAGTLDRPMNLSWDKTTKGFRESKFTLAVRGVDTAEWRPVAGTNLPSAKITADLELLADQDGRNIRAKLKTLIDEIAATVGSRAVRGARATLEADIDMLEFSEIGIRRLDAEVSSGADSLVRINGTLNHSVRREESGAQFTTEINLTSVVREFPVDGLKVDGGRARSAVTFTSKSGTTNIAVNVSVSGLHGVYGEMAFRDYQAALSMSLDLAGSTVSLQKFGLSGQSGFASGGSFDVTGRYELTANTGEFQFKSVNLNEGALGPFVAAALRPNRLVSVSIDVAGGVKLLPGGDADLAADLKVSRLLAEDPGGKLPKTPLALGLAVDASRRGPALDIRALKLDLGRSTNAENVLTLVGKLDFAPTNAAPSTLSVRSDGLDLTTLYGIFSGEGTQASSDAAPAPKPAAAGPPAGEPGPVKLPIRRFTADVDIAKLLLREVEVAGWKAKASLSNEVVALDPFSLELNGAPITAKADADLGVPGFRYDVALGANRLPLQPLVNSFMPERRGQIHGTLSANAALRGAGVTGAALGANLAGGFDFAATNMDLKLADTRNPLVRVVVGVVTGIPSLIKNPTGTVGSLLGRTLGPSRGGDEAWVEELKATPLDSIDLVATAGGGGVAFRTARIRSAAFQAEAGGGMRFAPALTNSTLDVPVKIALARRLAEKASLLDASVPPDAVYAPLPDFLGIKGTLGAPKPDIDHVAVAAMGAKTLGRSATGLGGRIGNLIGVGARTTNAVSATATNATANPLGELLRGLGRPKGN